MTGSTTIKVSTQTRDRLKAQAAAAHLTLGEHLDRLADRADREARFEAMRRSMRRTSAEEMTAYHREVADWEAAKTTDAADADR